MSKTLSGQKNLAPVFSKDLIKLIAAHKTLSAKYAVVKRRTDEIETKAFNKFAPYQPLDNIRELIPDIKIESFKQLYEAKDAEIVYTECDRLYREAKLIDDSVPFGCSPSLKLENEIIKIENKIIGLSAKFVDCEPDEVYGEIRTKLLSILGVTEIN